MGCPIVEQGKRQKEHAAQCGRKPTPAGNNRANAEVTSKPVTSNIDGQRCTGMFEPELMKSFHQNFSEKK